MHGFILQAINRSRAVITILLALVLSGIAAYVSIPKEADPDIPIPYVYVGVSLPGISPTDSERLIVKPLELELRRLTGVQEVTSLASQHHGAVILEFDVSFDKDKALADVREKVDNVRAKLPADADEPTISEFNTALFPIIMVSLSGNVPERELYKRARELKDILAAIPSVLEANLVGAREEVLEIIIDPAMMETYGISTNDLYAAISRNNQLVPAGNVDNGTGRFAISVPGLIENNEDIAELAIKTNGDAVIRLADIADIRRGFKDASAYGRFNGKPTIAIEVTKRLGANIIQTTQDVRDLSIDYTADWPETINIDFSSDFSTIIFDMIGGLEISITNAIALVMILVIAALGLRSALLVGMAIPTSFLIGFLIIDAMGYTLNMMIMFGLVLSVGILVDGAIVVVEYADRKMSEGLDKREAYAMAASRMLWPITSSTATTLAAFAPMLFWPGVSGKFMSYLPITVIIVLTASLLTAMVFLPVLGGLFGKTSQQGSSVLSGLAADSEVDVVDTPGPTGSYIRFLNKCIDRPKTTLSSAIIILVSVIVLYGQFGRGAEFFTQIEPHQAFVFVKARGNLSVEEANVLSRDVERLVLKTPGIASAFVQATTPGQGGFNPNGGEPRDMIVKILVEFTHYTTRKPATEILADIAAEGSKFPGIKVETREREDGPPTGKDLDIEVRGQNMEKLTASAKLIRGYLEQSSDKLTDLENSLDLPGIEWNLNVDREAAGRFGVDIATLGGIVQLVTDGVLIGKYRPDDSDDEIDIRARYPFDARSINKLDQLRISTPSGSVPITSFVTRSAEQKVGQVTRKDGFRVINLRANTTINPATGEKYLANEAVADFQNWLEGQELPAGIQVQLLGANKEQKDAAAFLGKAMIASLFLMFIILLMQFNSVYYTILTLSTVVLSTVGVMLGMIITGQLFSVIMTGTGVVALAGIVVNNSIVLIDTFQRLKDSMPSRDAILRAAGQRLRPILLTTITTMIGLLPMALHLSVSVVNRDIGYGSPEGSWWVQLATAIIFGLGFSTLLTLILVPVLITVPDHIREKRKSGWSLKKLSRSA